MKIILKQAFQKSVYIIIATTLVLGLNISKVSAAVSSSSLITLANSSRSQEGLGGLSENQLLTNAAYAKAQDMLDKDYFSHTSPDGRTPWDFILAAGYSYIYAGENLAIGYSDSSELHNAWMNSPSHRENIMNPNFREIGIAVVSGEYEGAETIVVVQMFGSQTSAPQEVQAEDSSFQEEVASESIAEENTEEVHDKEFTVNFSETNFSPSKVFLDDEVNFKIVLTGNFQDAYFYFDDQRIDMKDNVKTDGDKKILERKEKMTKEGSFMVNVTVTDQWGNKESKDLGKITIAKRVITKSNTSSGLGGIQKNIRDHWLVYLVSSLGILTIVGFIVVSRKAKYAKKLTTSISSWRL